jgi:hypothetical protein
MQLIFVELETPESWDISVLLPLFKKGSREDCSNYRGISLLCACFKLLESILLKRLGPVCPQRENQSGFRPGRSCVDAIFTLRTLLELRSEYSQPTIVVFIDFKAAFDSCHREGLWKVLREDGVPPAVVNVIKAMYAKSKCCVRVYNSLSDTFDVNAGVRQGGLLSPWAFNRLIDWVMRNAVGADDGIVCLRGSGRIGDIEYADDATLLSDDPVQMQGMLDRISEYAARVGLIINVSKTKVMHSCCDPPPLTIYNDPIEVVEHFKYLGSTVTSSGDASMEINIRTGQARAAFSALEKTLWSRRNINLKVKLKVYRSTVRSILLYGCETWPMKVEDARRLEACEMGFYRRILNIDYRDHVTNAAVLERVNSAALSRIVQGRRLSWLGHVLRMNDGRFPKEAMLFRPPRTWKRRAGGARLTWLRTVERDLKHLSATYRAFWFNDWLATAEVLARDTSQWNQIVHGIMWPP